MPILEQAVRVVAPHYCYICKRPGGLLCMTCGEDYCPPFRQDCYRCRQPDEDAAVCQSCSPSCPLKHVWVRTTYGNWAKQLIHDYKFARARAAAETLARVMAQAVPYLDRQTLVIPVPTATSRRRLRGYDHAALLARGLAKQLGLSYAPLLHRLGQSRQVGADRATRQRQLTAGFRLSHARLIAGTNVLLVDDVLTTGASLETTARVLRAAGAARVDAVVFARKQ